MEFRDVPQEENRQYKCLVCGKVLESSNWTLYCEEHMPPNVRENANRMREMAAGRMDNRLAGAMDFVERVKDGRYRATVATLPEIVAACKISLYGPSNAFLGLTFSGIDPSGIPSPENSTHVLELTYSYTPPLDSQFERTQDQLAEGRKGITAQIHNQGRNGGKSNVRGMVLGGSPMPVSALRWTPRPAPTRVLCVTSAMGDVRHEARGGWKRMANSYPVMDFTSRLHGSIPEDIRETLDPHTRMICDRAGEAVWSFGPDIISEWEKGPAQVITRIFRIGGKEFAGTLLYWPHKYSLCGFRLARPLYGSEFLLSGYTFGINLEVFVALMEGLVIINERSKLIEQYDDEFWLNQARRFE